MGSSPTESTAGVVALAPEGLAHIPARFRILSTLGRGGFGTVFEVVDRQSGRQLALKRLERLDPSSVDRFKREFRILQGHSHPRLVRLHELFAEKAQLCFTMDHVRGRPWLDWVRGAPCSADDGTHTTDEGLAPENATATTDQAPAGLEGSDRASAAKNLAPAETAPAPFVGPGDVEFEVRLRKGLRQLVEGVLELHALGVLHRDLKPSNVLVSDEGCLTIVDYGLAEPVGEETTGEGHFFGTPAYISPEQVRGAPLSMASDWYAVGVMLYEALTGRLPFMGTRADMLWARVRRDARPPESLAPHMPQDLCQLCRELLARDSFERPSGFQIAARVGVRPSVAASPHHVTGGAFVGRSRELERLTDCFRQVHKGRTVIAQVVGESGYGKTAMVHRFVNQLSLADEATVLQGKCFEQESVPFKAWDDLLDALSRHLGRISDVQAAALMPRDVHALVQVFPTLGRLPFIRDVRGRPASPDVQELRRRAFGALRELFARMSDLRPLVLAVDDVHWADTDSAELLQQLLAAPEVPPLLLIASYRPTAEPNDFVTTLLEGGSGLEVTTVAVGALEASTVEELARTLLPEGPTRDEQARFIAEESAGSPLFVAELVRAARSHKRSPRELTVQEVVRQRARRLTSAEQATLCLLAISERGLSSDDVAHLEGIPEDRASVILERLRDEQLATLSVSRGARRTTLLHDKIRQAILGSIDAEELARLHHRLATYFESRGATPETLFTHYLCAGDESSALYYSEKSADAARQRSAFNQAVSRYTSALELCSSEEDRARLLRKLAPTRAQAGLGRLSAQTHLAVAALGETDRDEQITCAGQQYLLSGFTDEALATLKPVLHIHGLAVPRSLLWGGLRLLWRRRRLHRQVMQMGTVTEKSDCERSTLAATDLSWTLANGFAGIDVFLSVHYTSVTLQRALACGDPERITRALSLEAILLTMEGPRGIEKAAGLIEKAADFSVRVANPHAAGWVAGARAILALQRWDLAACERFCRDSLELLRDSEHPSFREIGTLSVWFWLLPSFLLGKLEQLATYAPAIARESRARGDRYTHSTVRTYLLPLHWAARDQPQLARAEADAGLAHWQDGPWQNQHWAHLRSHCFVDLYEGHGERIRSRTRAARPKMKAALQLMVRLILVDLLFLEGRGLLEEARLAPSAGRLAQVTRCAARLHKQRHPCATLYARSLEAGRDALVGASDAANTWSTLARDFSGAAMTLHAAACELRSARLRRDESAESRALQALKSLGAHNPGRLADLLVP